MSPASPPVPRGMTQYLMTEDGARLLMGCFAALSLLAFAATGAGDKMAVRRRRS